MTGKRKRPTGEETFDIPGSPPLDTVVDQIVEDAYDRNSLENDADHVGEPDGADDGPSNILGSMEDGGAVQKTGAKKRKKRKSIGQQATKRAKAKTKVSPKQQRAVSEVKPESMSPSLPPEGSSRLDIFPAALQDPAEAQIQHELAGAAERGMRDSLVGDTGDEGLNKAGQGHKRKPKQTRDRKIKMPRRAKISDVRDPAIDPHLYSLPMSVPTTEHYDDPDDQDEEGELALVEEQDDDDEEDPESEEDEQGETDKEYTDIKPPPPPDQKPPIPTKAKRKKRKSIGQQRPKRPSTGHSTKPTPLPTTKKQPPQPPRNPRPSSQPNTTRQPPANTIPITIYRPPPLHSPDSDNDDDDPDPDPLTAPLPPQASTLNSIDVLSQMTRELLEKTAANPSLSTRAQRTIELYGRELEGRMKQLGQALATNAGLGKRLREVRKEERRVRGDLEGVEGELEGVREKVVEGREVERGVRLGGLMGGVGEVARRGWAWERERRAEGAAA